MIEFVNFYIVLTLYILSLDHDHGLFVSIIIIKAGNTRAHDMDYHNSKNVVLQEKEHEDVNIKDEVNDPMEEDDHAPKNTVEGDGTNTLIHDTFCGAIDHDD